MKTKTTTKPSTTTAAPMIIAVPRGAIPPLTQAAQAAYDGVREVRSLAIDQGCSNEKSNDLGGIMFDLSQVLDQLQGKRPNLAKIPDEITDKARIAEIVKRIYHAGAPQPGLVHPDDIAWAIGEAARLHTVRENLVKKVKELQDYKDQVQPWLLVTAGIDIETERDGGDWGETASGIISEARDLAAGRKPNAPTHEDPKLALDQNLSAILGKREHFDIQTAHEYLMLIGQRLYGAAVHQEISDDAPLENALETLRDGYNPSKWLEHGIARFSLDPVPATTAEKFEARLDHMRATGQIRGKPGFSGDDWPESDPY